MDVGNFLRMKSSVLYTELHDPLRPLINVEVVAHVTRPELRTSEVKFWFVLISNPLLGRRYPMRYTTPVPKIGA